MTLEFAITDGIRRVVFNKEPANLRVFFKNHLPHIVKDVMTGKYFTQMTDEQYRYLYLPAVRLAKRRQLLRLVDVMK